MRGGTSGVACRYVLRPVPRSTAQCCQSYDCRRVPLPIVAKIVGWSAGTMAKMAARYGHFGIDELRSAVEAISQPLPEIRTGSPQFLPQSGTNSGSGRAN